MVFGRIRTIYERAFDKAAAMLSKFQSPSIRRDVYHILSEWRELDSLDVLTAKDRFEITELGPWTMKILSL